MELIKYCPGGKDSDVEELFAMYQAILDYHDKDLCIAMHMSYGPNMKEHEHDKRHAMDFWAASYDLYLITNDTAIIGFTMIDAAGVSLFSFKEHADICTFYLKPEYRRQNFGKTAMDLLKGMYSSTHKGFTLQVFSDNKPAISFYKEKNGFKPLTELLHLPFD